MAMGVGSVPFVGKEFLFGQFVIEVSTGRNPEVIDGVFCDFGEDGGGNGSAMVSFWRSFQGDEDCKARIFGRDETDKRAAIIGFGIAAADCDLGGTCFSGNGVTGDAGAASCSGGSANAFHHFQDLFCDFFAHGVTDHLRFHFPKDVTGGRDDLFDEDGFQEFAAVSKGAVGGHELDAGNTDTLADGDANILQVAPGSFGAIAEIATRFDAGSER